MKGTAGYCDAPGKRMRDRRSGIRDDPACSEPIRMRRMRDIGGVGLVNQESG